MHRLPVFEAVTAKAAEQQGGILSEHPPPPYITSQQLHQPPQEMMSPSTAIGSTTGRHTQFESSSQWPRIADPTLGGVHLPVQTGLQQQPQMMPQPQMIPQPHSMPQPITPWSLDMMPWQTVSNNSDGVMQFSAHAMDERQRRAQLHQKRKPSNIESVPIPPKQFISEEKITAHFNGLHISSDHIQNSSSSLLNNDGNSKNAPRTTGKCFTNLTYRDYQLTAKELEEKLLNATCITMCEEVKKLHEEEKKKLTFLPSALSNHIENPSCNALVLWQPPPVLSLLQQQLNKDKEQKIGTSNAQNMSTAMLEGDEDDSQAYEICGNATDQDIEDFIDNNNTYAVDFNALKGEDMDEDL